ncbi:expressed protein, partial [Aureococcus anophagefferens]
RPPRKIKRPHHNNGRPDGGPAGHDADGRRGAARGDGGGGGRRRLLPRHGAREPRHQPPGHAEARGRRLLHGPVRRVRDDQEALRGQGHLRHQGPEAARDLLQARAVDVRHRGRGAAAAPADDHALDGLQGARQAPRGRHRDGLAHGALRRVPHGQDAALPHALRDGAAAAGPGRRRGQGHVHRHGGHVPAPAAPGHRGALRREPRDGARERRLRARAQQRAAVRAAQAGLRAHVRGPLLAPHRRLGDGPLPHGLHGPRRAQRAPDAARAVPAPAHAHVRRVRHRRRPHEPGRRQPRRHVLRQGRDEAHRRQHHRAREPHAAPAQEGARREPRLQGHRLALHRRVRGVLLRRRRGHRRRRRVKRPRSPPSAPIRRVPP